MSTADIIRSFREKVCAEVDLEGEGLGRYIVYTPFMFDDGDHFVVVLRDEQGQWVLSDEGHTFMHLSYAEVELATGTRAKVIDNALGTYRVQNHAGELRLAIPDEQFGDALFSFVQAISRITATALWTRDRVQSTFFEDFRALMEEAVPKHRLAFDYADRATDPEGLYVVDCKINGRPRPSFVFAIANDDQCQKATISCYHFERHAIPFTAAAVFEDQTAINRKTLARLSSVVGRQFPSLADRERMTRYFREEVPGVDT